MYYRGMPVGIFSSVYEGVPHQLSGSNLTIERIRKFNQLSVYDMCNIIIVF